jgi:hypothetical protein
MCLPDDFQEFDAVGVGHIVVADDAVVLRVLEFLYRFDGVGGRIDCKLLSLLFEVDFRQLRQLGVVVHVEDVDAVVALTPRKRLGYVESVVDRLREVTPQYRLFTHRAVVGSVQHCLTEFYSLCISHIYQSGRGSCVLRITCLRP